MGCTGAQRSAKGERRGIDGAWWWRRIERSSPGHSAPMAPPGDCDRHPIPGTGDIDSRQQLAGGGQ